MCQNDSISTMQSVGIILVIVFCFILYAGCIQLPGMHIISNSPDPIVGQWIGGEPPSSERHIIFYENNTFLSMNFFLNSAETTDTGNWTKTEPGLYSLQSSAGEETAWVYDSYTDSMYKYGLPQLKYYRYKG